MKEKCKLTKTESGMRFLPWEVTRTWGMMVCLKSSTSAFLMKFITSVRVTKLLIYSWSTVTLSMPSNDNIN